MYDIGAIIQAADIENVLGQFGIDTDRRQNKNGFELYFHCINTGAHDGPSKKMSIAESGQYKGLFYCWSCGARGNVIQLVQYFKNCTTADALQWMDGFTGVGELLGTESLKYKVKREKLNYGVTNDRKEREPYTYPTVKQITDDDPTTQGAFRYLRHRHISEGTQRKFRVGLSEHRTIGWAITIPIDDGEDLASIFYGQPRDGGLKRYPKDAPHGEILFNYEEALDQGRYILVESVLDVLYLDTLGIGPAVCCFTNMVTDDQLDLLKPFKEHCVMPDMDSPRGWDLVDRTVKRLDKSVWLALPPVGKDPGDCEPWEIVDSFAQRQRYCDWEVDNFISKTTMNNGNVNRLLKK